LFSICRFWRSWMSIFSLFYFCQICFFMSFYCFMIKLKCNFMILLQYVFLKFNFFFELSKFLLDFYELGIAEWMNYYSCWIFYCA
jgi:hypothetical protein